MPQEEKYIGYLRYSGKSIESGLLDARKAAEALLGFDQILRHFLLEEDPTLESIDFEIPVRIKHGSWEALIPEIIDKIISWETAMAVYGISTARKAATDGLFETGTAKDIKALFRHSLKSIQWVIKITSHKFKNIKEEVNGQETFIVITNDENQTLKIPKKYFDSFIKCPKGLFEKNARIVEPERTLELGLFENNKEVKVPISEKNKTLFYKKEDKEEIILPELKHDQIISIEGEIVRATENRNSIGLSYKGYTLDCKPESGKIARYKNKIVSREQGHLFLKVCIQGKIDRMDGNREKRPVILFSKITEIKNAQKSLF